MLCIGCCKSGESLAHLLFESDKYSLITWGNFVDLHVGAKRIRMAGLVGYLVCSVMKQRSFYT